MQKWVNRLFVTITFGLLFILAACGEKSQEDVIEKLEESIESMDGYKVHAEMKMSTGQEEQTYGIDVWHKKDHYYRVSLANENDEKGGQVILKNDDGVYVLTPALNKKFKFQTDWPENSSQPYLYQSLVNDVVTDGEAAFEATESHYVFQTKTNYQSNNNLPYQEIAFHKKTFTPEHVKVMDKDKNVVVEVTFTEFEMDPEFQQADFELDESMTGEENDQETSAQPEEAMTLEVLFPLETLGAELIEQKEVDLEDGKRVILTFEGDKNFKLIQEKKDVAPTMTEPEERVGDIVNIGDVFGALTENGIEWSKDGVDYYLASEELTKEELMDVAASVQGREVK